MCIVALIAGGEGKTMSECNKLLPSLSSVHMPVLQPIILMQMERVSFDALISLPAVCVPRRLPAVHRKPHCLYGLSVGEVVVSFTASFLHVHRLVKFIHFITCGFWDLSGF